MHAVAYRPDVDLALRAILCLKGRLMKSTGGIHRIGVRHIYKGDALRASCSFVENNSDSHILDIAAVLKVRDDVLLRGCVRQTVDEDGAGLLYALRTRRRRP